MPAQWTAFIPYTILIESRCYLCGTVCKERRCVQITSQYTGQGDLHGIVGLLTDASDNVSSNCKSLPEIFIILSKNDNGQLSCSIHREGVHEESCNCIVFNPDEIQDSYFVSDKYHDSDTSVMSYICGQLGRENCWETCQVKFMSWILWLFQTLSFIVNNRLMSIALINKIVSIPAISCYLLTKREEYKLLKNHRMNSGLHHLGICNIFYRQILDSLLGILMMYMVMQTGIADYMADFILTWADHAANRLETLLNWLMGAPAGLKLNRQLTEFLGHFFLYHIYLWKGYLRILQPILGSVIWYTSLLGIVGLKAQLCLLQDIVSMMALHIYCFYVYAARLYRLQVYLLAALWRLFRGKKWNVLRLRVDSAAYDVDQLFLGTLLFTILLFMLPTTALYYIVFTGIRMLVLISQSSLSVMVDVLNSIPVFSTILWVIQHKAVAGDLLFDQVVIDTHNNEGHCHFSMKVCQMPFTKMIKESRNPFTPDRPSQISCRKLLGAILSGELIYPWVEVNTS